MIQTSAFSYKRFADFIDARKCEFLALVTTIRPAKFNRSVQILHKLLIRRVADNVVNSVQRLHDFQTIA